MPTIARCKKYTELQEAAQAAALANPSDAEAQYFSGRAYMGQNKIPEMIAAFGKAVELAPNNCEYLCSLGDAYGVSAIKTGVFSALGRAKKCKAAYEKAVTLEPANLRARASLATYLTMAPGIAGGSMKKAYEQIAEVEKLQPAIGWKLRVAAYLEDKKYSDAHTMISEKLAAEPDDYFALTQAGALGIAAKQYADDGIKALNHCLELTPAPGLPRHERVQFRLGNLYEKKGDKAAARAAYEAALAIRPEMKDAQTALEKLK